MYFNKRILENSANVYFVFLQFLIRISFVSQSYGQDNFEKTSLSFDNEKYQMQHINPFLFANITLKEKDSNKIFSTGSRIHTDNNNNFQNLKPEKVRRQKNNSQQITKRKSKNGLLYETHIDYNVTKVNPIHVHYITEPTNVVTASHKKLTHKHRDREKQKIFKNGSSSYHSNNQNDKNIEIDLYPPIFNIAPRAEISVNATCGQFGPEEYCKLVDAYPKKLTTQCNICNMQSSDVAKHRPIDAVISNSNFDEQWWQSPPLNHNSGKEFEYVSIIIDLKQAFQVFFIMLKSANSPRPASWILEKSLDGTNFETWQYFGLSDADCKRRYNMNGNNGKYVFKKNNEIICSTQFSKPLPLENGELHISLLKNRPGAVELLPELMNFVSTRYIRIRFQGLHYSSNFDNTLDWLLDTQSLEKRSFYSLKQIRVSGRLDCHGHAEKITEYSRGPTNKVDRDEYFLKCSCQHNTCGPDCSECCPLFWKNQTNNIDNYFNCEKCECNGHANSCIYNDTLKFGVCKDCQNGTTGQKCETCASGFYRLKELASTEACVPCNCNIKNSVDICNSETGDCYCREGFEGSLCEECSTGYFGDDCKKCDCNLSGTIPYRECNNTCQCKRNVNNDKYCSICLPGYFDLSLDNPDGCTPCWCSGVGSTVECTSALIKVSSFETLTNWKVTNIEFTFHVIPDLDSDTNFLSYGNYDTKFTEDIYWQAPEGYLGNKLRNYGSILSIQVSWVTIRGDTSGKPTIVPNIILIGKNGIHIAHGLQMYIHETNLIINVTLEEHGWYHLPMNKMQSNMVNPEYIDIDEFKVTRPQFLSILTSIKALLIRAVYHTDQVETWLERVILFTGGSGYGEVPTTKVEYCACPIGYTGFSCESCQFGYVQSIENSTSSDIKCTACPCNGHSESCDKETGDCGKCLHNTIGSRCEHCKVGFYGNPLTATSEDCKPCACPLLVKSNNFSPTCQRQLYDLIEDTIADEYICTQCPKGYAGIHCEKCDEGYYGNPMEIGSKCNSCDCSGGPCNMVTGQCLICNGNTEGLQCERCKKGYWGDPSVHCEPCNCSIEGSDSDVCDSSDGQCLCKPYFSGQKCDVCAGGFTNISSKCIPCNCDVFGSEDLLHCNIYTGQCNCKPGVIGLTCNACMDGYFRQSQNLDRCENCDCNPIGSVATICGKQDGQCECNRNVDGKRCEKCKLGFWNLTKEVGCIDCLCNSTGSIGLECDTFTGQCNCNVGITGQKCDKCAEGFFGFSSEGCLPCNSCSLEGQICNHFNGHCSCPPNSRGLGCTQCMSGTWAWRSEIGCTDCVCDTEGSIGNSCDQHSGQCLCREGYTGRQCNLCAIGYFGYPECRRCNCNVDGSFIREDGLIECDSNGQCPCKTHVIGHKCDTCIQATFGISRLNPDGCTPCFCFGRSTDCKQSELSWGHIRLSTVRAFSVKYLSSHKSKRIEYNFVDFNTNINMDDLIIINGLNVIPGCEDDIIIQRENEFRKPLYFQLPSQFTGDRTNSYNGYMYFTTNIEGSTTPLRRDILHQYPLIQIHAHKNVILDFYEYERNEYLLNASYKIPIIESYWKMHTNGQITDRRTFMTALQNVKYIFLRATTFADFKTVELQDVLLDSAILINGSTNNIAKGVELCKCSNQFNGLSCQNPGKGFYRWRNVSKIDSLDMEDLIGKAIPCQCNGRSSSCDSETGICLGCRNNTGGTNCEQCADGFYGDTKLALLDCQPCPCPETNRNFAKGCNIQEGTVSCVCQPGYAGQFCEHCENGYFRNKQEHSTSSCIPCNCNHFGSTTINCDNNTGNCYCRPDITGSKCDKCFAYQHFFNEGECKICDNCSLLLLDNIDFISETMYHDLNNINLTSIPPPFKIVHNYLENYNKLNNEFWNIKRAHQILTNYDTNALIKTNSYAENAKFQFRKSLGTAKNRNQEMNSFKSNVNSELNMIKSLNAEITQTIKNFNNFDKNKHIISAPNALHMVKNYLEFIRNHYNAMNNIRLYNNCAWHYLYYFGNLSDNAFDQEVKAEIFWQSLNKTNFRISDLRIKTDQIQEKQREIEDIFEHIINIRNYLLEDLNIILKLSETNEIDSIKKLVPEANVLHDIILGRKSQLANEIESIARLSAILNGTLNEREEQFREVQKHWIPKAERRALHLIERLNDYVRQLQNSQQRAHTALLASSVHKNISNAVYMTQQSFKNAMEYLGFSQATINPTKGTSQILRSRSTSEASGLLKKNAQAITNETNLLKRKFKTQNKILDQIKNKILSAGLRTNNISLFIQSMGQLTEKNLCAESTEIIKIISDELQIISDKINQMELEISNLRSKFVMLQPDWEIILGMAEENISLTRTNIRLVNISLIYVEDNFKIDFTNFTKWNTTMFKRIQSIKENVLKAKHIAEGIKVPLKSLDHKCLRSYIPKSYGVTTFNSIKLTFSMTKYGNSPLLHIQGVNGTFQSIELHKRRVRFSWNLGGSTAIISYPLEIHVGDPRHEDSWYYVEVNRTLNIGSLFVEKVHSQNKFNSSNIITAYTDQDHTRFIQTKTEHIYVGASFFKNLKRDRDLQLNIGLNVIMYKIQIDNEPIGIWNFRTTEGNCGGAEMSLEGSYFSSSARHFNGMGYAEIRRMLQIMQRKNVFALQMNFKTLDENALLFLSMDEKNKRFLSVFLQMGKICFYIDYGNNIKMEIITSKKYNKGTWVYIEVARQFVPRRGTDNGVLRVNNEVPLIGSPSIAIKNHMLPDLSKSLYYLGGVPPGITSDINSVVNKTNSLLGCIKDIHINGEAYDPLERSSYFGVEQSCKDTITKTGFMGKGYMELPSQSLWNIANVGFIFQSTQSNCLLLLSTYPPVVYKTYNLTSHNSYSISLFNGYLEVWIHFDQTLIKLLSATPLNNGEFHVVNLIRNEHKLELRIDDQLQDVKQIKELPIILEMEKHMGGLYLGGVPLYTEYMSLSPTLIGLEGSIKNLILNNITINFNQVLESTNVRIGRNGPVLKNFSNIKSFPNASSNENCEQVDSYSYEPNAFKYGDKPYAFSKIHLKHRNLLQRDFQISFSFRSFYANGMIFLSHGTKIKYKHYFALMLKNGQLTLIVRGRRREKLVLGDKLNNGIWHKVNLYSIKRKITMSVEIGHTDQKSSVQLKIQNKISSTNLLLVGGKPQSLYKLPLELLKNTQPFKGCLKNIVIFNKTHTLSNSIQHKNVNQCFRNIEFGVHFPGDGYILYKKEFNFTGILEFYSEFRTTKLSGILFSIYLPTSLIFLNLEFRNGDIIFFIYFDNKVLLEVPSNISEKYILCDKKWHNISFYYDHKQIVIQIDQIEPIVRVLSNLIFQNKTTASLFYIGGLPDTYKKNNSISNNNFKGCLRNISILKEHQDWTKMEDLQKVSLNECVLNKSD